MDDFATPQDFGFEGGAEEDDDAAFGMLLSFADSLGFSFHLCLNSPFSPFLLPFLFIFPFSFSVSPLAPFFFIFYTPHSYLSQVNLSNHLPFPQANPSQPLTRRPSFEPSLLRVQQRKVFPFFCVCFYSFPLSFPLFLLLSRYLSIPLPPLVSTH